MPQSSLDRLTALVSETAGVRREQLSEATQLLRDLGIDGDDAAELMTAFAREFGVDMTGFRPSEHFGPEAGFNPFLWLLSLFEPPLTPITLGDLARSAEAGVWQRPQASVGSRDDR